MPSYAFSQIPKIKKNFSLDERNLNRDAFSNPQFSQTNITAQPSGPRTDSLSYVHRDDSKNAITITYKFLDSIRRNDIDSSIDDFDRYFSVPSSYIYLGNNGAAANSIIYQPRTQIGFDPGFHAFDIYQFHLENTKFYNTTKPFTSLSYQLASGKEQMLKVDHTQNINARFNAGFNYKLISAPGFFVTQNNNHKSYQIFSSYQGKQKRYSAYFTMLGNNIRASENGGVKNADYLSDPNRKDRFTIPVNLGSNAAFRNNPFVTTVFTGNQYRNSALLLRQSYDFGKHDSIAVNDSTTEHLFYPTFRLQYTIASQKYRYAFGDIYADSSVYANWYGLTLKKALDTVSFLEKWNVINHDLSVIQFPDTKNLAQFFLAGATYQKITGDNIVQRSDYYNLFLHSEYRNRTRNKLWNMLAKAQWYLDGLNRGDYSAFATLNRHINNKLGDVRLFFYNANRTASYIFNKQSAFNLTHQNEFNKEHIFSLGIASENEFVHISFNNHLLINYTYFKNYYQSAQYNRVINLAQLAISKKINLGRKWYWHTEFTLQQTDLSAPLKVPLLYTRNRLAFEGRFYKNLMLSTGIEARYFSAYKANGYSPLVGQFFSQDSVVIKNLPDITLFTQFRIRNFAGYLRAENLNTARFDQGLTWTNNNFAAPLYPTQGLMIRFGVQWWFVN